MASIGVPANMLVAFKRSYGQQHSFQILSTFSYDNFASWLTGQHSMVAQHVLFNLFSCYSLKVSYLFYFNLHKDCQLYRVTTLKIQNLQHLYKKLSHHSIIS